MAQAEKPRILIVDDMVINIKVLSDHLKPHYQVQVATNGPKALEIAAEEPRPDMILLDIMMPQMDGYTVLTRLQADPGTRDIPVIFLTAKDAEEDETRGLAMGAVDYITKPFSPPIVKARIKTHLSLQQSIREMMRAQLKAQSLQKQVGALNSNLVKEALKNPEAFAEIVTISPQMRTIFHYMEAICDSGEPVLVTGETGAGKELIARGLHRLGGRAGKLVSVNLAGLDDETFSDTLFGHTKGAFTGANQDRKGFISQAEGGTLFLDEIGDLLPASQIKLLRLLQEKLYYPLGADTPSRMDVQIIAATHRDLQARMNEGHFRQDLFFRLSAHHIRIPALRDRREDIPPLTFHFLEEAGKAMDRPPLDPPPELLQLLETYHFPGNVRELRAIVFDAVAQHRTGAILSMKSIQKTIEERRSGHHGATRSILSSTPDHSSFQIEGSLPTLEEAENVLVSEAMRQAKNNQGIAASLLGISRSALNRRLNRRLRHLLDTQE
ncbi:MAG: sigma-54-dependent Fis family transcriptional regulator [Magnetococcales bacterium]|nr:sigma-54-dependent Fis family transcriptional regulator [Magnetococcales bacterium]